MKLVHLGRHLLPIKHEKVLYRLLVLAQHVDNVLRQLPAEQRCSSGEFRADALHEAAEEVALEGIRGQAEGRVLLHGQLGEGGYVVVALVAGVAPVVFLRELP